MKLFIILLGLVCVTSCQSTQQSLKGENNQKIVRTAPKYPRLALRRGITGFVEMKFNVSTDGKTKNIVVVNSEPKKTFDKSAVKALSQWTYYPKIVNGHAVEMKDLMVTLHFDN